jgi:hypothetical protein
MKVGIDQSLACRKFPRGIGIFEEKLGLCVWGWRKAGVKLYL